MSTVSARPPSGAWSNAASCSARKTASCGYSGRGRYPVIDGEAEREVKLRIMEVLFSDVIPSPRDVVIIGLVDACGLFGVLLSRRELQRVAERIKQVRQLDLIGQAVVQTVADIDMAISGAMRTIM